MSLVPYIKKRFDEMPESLKNGRRMNVIILFKFI